MTFSKPIMIIIRKYNVYIYLLFIKYYQTTTIMRSISIETSKTRSER